jgi:hypothetical protein
VPITRAVIMQAIKQHGLEGCDGQAVGLPVPIRTSAAISGQASQDFVISAYRVDG